ncbi:MAG: electron transfer flavoprotein subunit alpha/FixB family protein [Flavobacteriaceae bacterium]
MSVLVFIESQNGQIKKGGFEVASYGRALADELGESLVAVTFGVEDYSSLNTQGVDKIYRVNLDQTSFFDVEAYSNTLAEVVHKETVTIAAVSSSADGRYLGPVLAAKIDAAFLSNVVSLPLSTSPLVFKRTCFTNKAFNETESKKERTVIALSSNSYGIFEKKGSAQILDQAYIQSTTPLKVSEVDKATDKVTIADADIVVSGGRGLKGPENWHLIEDLAETLGAATACSKPVSDLGWRPHSEHVGQTGKPVASNLYIAIGVSGAIQHLAGINSSKVKVVINNDPEAPFFKAADYGVVGDAFEVVPKLTQKLKSIKG